MIKLLILFILISLIIHSNSIYAQKEIFQQENSINENDSQKTIRKPRRKTKRKIKKVEVKKEQLETSEICPNERISIFKPNLNKTKTSVLFGKISDKTLNINLKQIPLPNFNVNLAASNNTIDMTKYKFISPATFKIEMLESFSDQITEWSLIIFDQTMTVAEEIVNKGSLPEEIVWRKISNKNKLKPDNSYFYSLSVKTGSANSFTTAPQPFIIRSVAAIRTRIATNRLESYDKIFSTAKTQKFLKRLTHQIKKHPEETIHIVGYVTDSNPHLCDNLFRLRNFLVGKADIPIERFYVSCSKTTDSDPESKGVTIAGTKPSQAIDLIDFKPKEKHTVRIDNKKIDLDENNLFLFPQQKSGHTYYLELHFASGEKLLLKDSFEKNKLLLSRGENFLEKAHIRLDHDFSPAISCGSVQKKSINWTASLGFGPYNMSDSYAPGISQITLFKFSLTRQNIKIIGSRNYSLKIDGFAIPGSFTANKKKNQTLYHASSQLGYEIKTKNVNITPFAGYYYLTSNELSFNNNSFIQLSYGGLIGIKVALNKFLWKRVSVTDELKIKPFMFVKAYNLGIQNNFVLTYHFTRNYGTSFTWLKTAFRYKNGQEEQNLSQNLDAYVFSFVYKF